MNYIGHFRDLFGNRQVLTTLEFFLNRPTTQFAQGQVTMKTRLAKATAAKALGVLERHHIIVVQRVGRTKLYKLNRESPLVRQVKRFYNLTSPMLPDFLGPLRHQLVKAVVFGSYGRGEDREDSDVDILLVGDIREADVQPLIDAMFRKYRKRIAPILRTQEEYIAMPKKEPVLWNKIIVGGEVLHGT